MSTEESIEINEELAVTEESDTVENCEETSEQNEMANDGGNSTVTDETAESDQETDPLAELTAKCGELENQLLRQRAEFDNYRKRMSREAEQIRKKAAESLIIELLPVLDNLERAVQHAEDPEGALAQGVTMVLKQFCDAMNARGLEPISSVGEEFDPNIHEALSQMASAEVDEGKIITEYERGYRLGGFVIRPAKVIISTGAEAENTEEENETPAE